MTETTTVLAMDTALAGCAAAVAALTAGRMTPLAQKRDALPRGQAERLMPMVEDVLASAALTYADIGLVAVTHGPGSFAGLRVGLAAARHLSLVLGIPAVGVSTTAALARQFRAAREFDGILVVLIETKRTDYYMQVFDADMNSVRGPEAVTRDDLIAFLPESGATLIGDGLERFLAENHSFSNVSIGGYDSIDPFYIAEAAALDYFKNPEVFGKIKPSPLYLRDADVTISTKKKREILT